MACRDACWEAGGTRVCASGWLISAIIRRCKEYGMSIDDCSKDSNIPIDILKQCW